MASTTYHVKKLDQSIIINASFWISVLSVVVFLYGVIVKRHSNYGTPYYIAAGVFVISFPIWLLTRRNKHKVNNSTLTISDEEISVRADPNWKAVFYKLAKTDQPTRFADVDTFDLVNNEGTNFFSFVRNDKQIGWFALSQWEDEQSLIVTLLNIRLERGIEVSKRLKRYLEKTYNLKV